MESRSGTHKRFRMRPPLRMRPGNKLGFGLHQPCNHRRKSVSFDDHTKWVINVFIGAC
jgi:hypothetical protein